MEISVNPRIHARATEVLHTSGVQGPYIAIAPFTTRPQKHWPMNHWKNLITLLRDNFDIPIVVLGGPTDTSKGLEFETYGNNVISLAGNISLAQSVAVVAQCHAFIGVDTGLTHLADSYQKPTVAIFGSTRPYTRTANSGTCVLFKDMPCAPCKRKPSCEGRFDCMQSITPEDVIACLPVNISC
ncbi:hypothetical protein D210916BOD24_00180 [Alteromonas sp. D210916BOD_24]